MRDPHRPDEVLLEPRLGGRLDLLHAADDRLDLRAGGAVEQRDAGAGAGRVAGARHVRRLAVRNEPEHHRVHRVDVRAERAGQPDPIDRLDPEVVHQQSASRIERPLRELDLAHVVLGQHQARALLVDHVGVRAAVLDDALGAGGGGRIDDAVGGQHPGEEQLGDELDDAGARDAGRRRRSRLVGPDVAADRAVPKRERFPVDAHALDRPRRRTLSARDLRALERRAGGARRGEQPLAVAKHDLGVRPDVDDEVDDVLVVRRLRQDHAGGVGADVPGDQRQRVGTRARVRDDAELADRHGQRFVGHERKRRAAELGRVEPEDEVVHDRVADDDELEDVVARRVGLRAELAHQLVEAAAHRGRQLDLAARVHHHVAHPAHQVLAKPDLGVHRAGAREHVAGVQVAQMPCHRRRADIERHAQRHIVEPGEDRGDQRAISHGDRGGPGTGAQGGLQSGQHDRIDRQAGQGPVALERGEEALQVAARRVERRRARSRRSAAARPDRPRSHGRRPPCGRPAGGSAIPGGTSISEVAADLRVAAEAPVRPRGRRAPGSAPRAR